MGTTYTLGATKESIVAEITKTQDVGNDSVLSTIRYSLRGQTLWCLHETKKGDDVRRWIGCYLLRAQRSWGWGYKDMSEEMGPYYYNCPTSYLDLAPVTCQEWRDKVWYNTPKARKLRKLREDAAKRAENTEMCAHTCDLVVV